MWSKNYLLFTVSVLWSENMASSLYKGINMTMFKDIDSEFDFEAAIENFKQEDFDIRNIEGIEHVGAKFNYFPKKLPNRTSAENKKLIEDSWALVDTSGEREHQKMLKEIEKKMHTEFTTTVRPESVNKRVKRDGEGKFAEAAKVSNLKMLRIYLAMFSNLWSKNYLGGSHPMHKDVPKGVMILFKHRIMEFFFPPVGESKV